MGLSLILHIAAFAALVPLSLTPLRRQPRRDVVFWAFLALAILGSTAVAAFPAAMVGGWNTSFSNALLASIAATLILFAGLCALKAPAFRIVPLLLPYLLGLGVMATIWAGAENTNLLIARGTLPFWTTLHIAVALMVYGLLTLAAMGTLAGFYQERALKSKRPTPLTRRLPAAIDSDEITHQLLIGSEVVLGLGILTGMGLQFAETGDALLIDHKTVLSLMAFGLIGCLLFARAHFGVRGRLATRAILWAYLLVTLAFPGIKFVTDFVL